MRPSLYARINARRVATRDLVHYAANGGARDPHMNLAIWAELRRRREAFGSLGAAAAHEPGPLAIVRVVPPAA